MTNPEDLAIPTSEAGLSDGDIARALFLMPGEKFHSNYGITHTQESSLPTLEEYLVTLRQSGKFASVRTSSEAVFDVNGKPYQGAVAIFVVPNPDAPKPEA